MATLVKIRGLETTRSSSGSVISGRGFRVRLSTSGTPATYTTSLTGANNDVKFTAKNGGPWGNDITVTYVDPGGATATAGVVVSGHGITVNLGRASSAINTTGANIKTLIDADANASALVSVANAAGNDGTGLVTALATQTLTGGSWDEAFPQNTNVYATVNSGSTVVVDIDDPQVQKVLKRNHYRWVSLGLA